MEDTIHLKKTFLITLIVSLIGSAIIGVVIFLLGNFSEIEIKILWTTGIISGFSLIGLVISWFYEKDKFKPLPKAALIYIIFGFLASIIFIWGNNTSTEEILFKFASTILQLGSLFFWGIIFYHFFKKKNLPLFTGGGLILLIFSFIVQFLSIWELIGQDISSKLSFSIFVLFFSILHISLLWLAKNNKTIVNVSLFFTMAMISIVATLLMIFFVGREDLPTFFFRVLGAFAILDGVGTVVTPIIRKVVSLHNNPSK